MNIKIYEEFVLDNQANLLLEGFINYKTEFRKILTNIDSEISNLLLDIQGDYVDIVQNHIDVNFSKDDVVSFIQDNKVFGKSVDQYRIDVSLTNHLSKTFDEFSPISYNNLEDYVATFDRVITPNDPLYKLVSKERVYTIVDVTLGDVKSKAVALVDIDEKSNEIKIGRFVRALLNKSKVGFSDKDIEEFVNAYKLQIKLFLNAFDKFEVVKGDKIKFWYSSKNSILKGTIGSSCMRYDRCQKFFDIYIENPENISLLILKSDEDSSKISGRALLWKDDDDKFIMDRVYVADSSDTVLFIEYAKYNGFLYKRNQDYSTTPLVLNGKVLSDEESYRKITLKDSTFSRYPYIDTFKFLKDNTLSNSRLEGSLTLSDTNGGDGSCDECGGSGYYLCDECTDGKAICNECDGEGCDYCENGKVDCDYCDGVGQFECNECGY